jgi:hypothetical protein
MPPLPSSARSSWQDLFLDPFRPTTPPSSFNYASEQQNQQQHDLQEPRWPRRFPNLNLTQLEEDIPELEDVDDEDDDIDGPPPKVTVISPFYSSILPLNPCNLISCVTEACSKKKFIVFW